MDICHILEPMCRQQPNKIIVKRLTSEIRFVRLRIDNPIHGNMQPDMTAILQGLSTVLFASVLRDVTVKWAVSIDADGYTRGLTTLAAPSNVGRVIDILLLAEPYLAEDAPRHSQSRSEACLNSLSHEAIYAMLYATTCFGSGIDQVCSLKWGLEAGCQGHDPAFHRIAKMVEDRVNQLGLWKCDLGRKGMVERYLRKEEAEDEELRIEAEVPKWKNRKVFDEMLAFCWPDEKVYKADDKLIWIQQQTDTAQHTSTEVVQPRQTNIDQQQSSTTTAWSGFETKVFSDLSYPCDKGDLA